MQLFSHEKRKARAIAHEAECRPLHQVAPCLALWLGMMVCTFGLIRLSNDAVQRAENPNPWATVVPAVYPIGLGS